MRSSWGISSEESLKSLEKFLEEVYGEILGENLQINSIKKIPEGIFEENPGKISGRNPQKKILNKISGKIANPLKNSWKNPQNSSWEISLKFSKGFLAVISGEIPDAHSREIPRGDFPKNSLKKKLRRNFSMKSPEEIPAGIDFGNPLRNFCKNIPGGVVRGNLQRDS